MMDNMGLQLKEYYSLWDGINALYAQWAKAQGLTYDSLFVLQSLYYSKEPRCQKEICEEWSMPKQTVNSILKNFAKQGYIYLKTAERDKRSKGILLTSAGQEMASDILSRLDIMERNIVGRMGTEQMQALLKGTEYYYNYLKEEVAREKDYAL